MNPANGPDEIVLTASSALVALLERLDAPDPPPLAPAQARELAGLATRLLARLGTPAGGASADSPDKSEQLARLFFDYALTGIFETDHDGRICRANPAAVSITGHDARALAGRPLLSLATPAATARLARHLALLPEQGIGLVDFELTRSDRSTIVVTMSSVQIDDEHFMHVFDDVTEQRRAEAAIRSAQAAAEAANRAKSEFLTNVSHEIRTPLNAIIGLGQLVLGTELGAQQHDYVEKLLRSARTLLRLVKDLLDTARLEAGQMEFEDLPYALDGLLADLDDLRTAASGDREVAVGFHVAREVPGKLSGDRLRLGQCLRNLLGNAIKFTRAGRVDLRVEVAGGDDRPMLRFVVEDTGIGIAREALPRLFAPFSQADASTTRRFGGSGLGLYISRELVRGMGGELAVDSTPGQGSRFTLTLPLRPATSDAGADDGDLPGEVPREFRGQTILLAEDDPTNQLVATEWLARAGIATLVAGNGFEALARFAGAGETNARPALILMDVQMPELDGLEATRRLRAQGCTVPIIGLSAGASLSEQEACLAAGMSDFLAKPIDVDELWGCLTRWLPPVPAERTAAGESVDARFLGDRVALARARDAFRSTHAHTADRLLALLERADRRGAERLAHALRGAAATLGLEAIARLAGDLEQRLRDHPPDTDLVPLCGEIGRLLTRAISGFGPVDTPG